MTAAIRTLTGERELTVGIVACQQTHGARNPVALERLTYDRAAKVVRYSSEKSERPTAGTETADPLVFLVRVLVHIPDKGHVTTRSDGWYANRPAACGARRRARRTFAGYSTDPD